MGEKSKMRRETIQQQVCKAFTDRKTGVRTIAYDPKTRRYRVVGKGKEQVEPELAPSNPYAVMVGAEAERLWAEARGEAPFFDLPVEDVFSQVAVGFGAERFAPITEAILRRRALSLGYLPKTGKTFFATFSPHTIVKTAFRVHVRGYAQWADGKDNAFIDVVPGRILEARIDELARYVGPTDDTTWHERIPLRAELRTGLPQPIKELMRREYNFSGTGFDIPEVRRAMLKYVVDTLELRRLRDYPGPIWTCKEFSPL